MTQSNNKFNIVHEKDLFLHDDQNERVEVISPTQIRATESADTGYKKP